MTSSPLATALHISAAADNGAHAETPWMPAAIIAAGLAFGGMAPAPSWAQPMMQGPMMQQQPGAGMMPGMGMMYGQGLYGQSMYGPGMMMGLMGGYTEGMVAFLKAELGVTAQQEALWSSFATALRQFGASMPGHQMQKQLQTQQQPLPEMLASRIGWMETHLAALKSLRDAATPFYAALTPEQKAKADSLLGGCPPCRI